jgi:hypothetical protein
MKGHARNFRFFKSKDATLVPPPTNAGPEHNIHVRARDPNNPKSHRTANTGQWAMDLWPQVKPIFMAAPDKRLRYDDQRLIDVLVKSGRNAKTLSPMLSELGRRNLVCKVKQGVWAMV